MFQFLPLSFCHLLKASRISLLYFSPFSLPYNWLLSDLTCKFSAINSGIYFHNNFINHRHLLKVDQKKKKPPTHYLLTHQQLQYYLDSVYYSVIFRLFTIFNTVIIIHILANFYCLVRFSVDQQAHRLYMYP